MYDVIIVGAGFTGLTAAMDLSKNGHSVLVLDRETAPGGLAGVFEFKDGVVIEKFYHHWFTSDEHVGGLVEELGMKSDVLNLPSRTGMYYNKQMWRLSSPLDLLQFKVLPLIDRIRLGLVVLGVRFVKDWKRIENLSIREWLEPLCGKRVYDVVWKPLIESKFSIYADSITAVWFWKKLVLRGGTRGSSGGEELSYFRGGFGRLAEKMADRVVEAGGQVIQEASVTSVQSSEDVIRSVTVSTKHGLTTYEGREFLFTPPFPIVADMFEGASELWLAKMRRVNYLGNICLVLQLDRSLSDSYWINVNDPGFPFVGVIEHTNLDTSAAYGGSSIVYLSRYISTSDENWALSDELYLQYAIPYLKMMFPEFDDSWLIDAKVWRSPHAQAVTERGYSQYVPASETPYRNGTIATMAQIYPEDRGTNYAIREGRKAAALIGQRL